MKVVPKPGAPRPKLVFTRNGKPLPPSIPAPPKANDLHIVFDPASGMVLVAWWTRNGDPLGPPIPVPRGANDWWFRVGPGGPLPPPIVPPPGVNDFEVVWRRQRIVEAWWTYNGKRVERAPIDDRGNVHFGIRPRRRR